MAMKTYDPGDISVVFAGLSLTEGLAPDTFVKVETPEDSFNFVQGADGHSTRSKSGKRMKRVMLTVLQTSDVNDKLSAIHNLDLLAPNGAGVGPFLLKDSNGTTIVAAPAAYILKDPDMEYAEEDKFREWTFILADPKQHTGGAN